MNCINIEVISNTKIFEDIYEIVLKNDTVCKEASAGQFLHIDIKNGNGGFLRRPISISRLDKENGYIVLLYHTKGKGTKYISQLKTGEILNALGPLGKGFPINENKKCAVVGGGIGIAPLLELAGSLDSCDAYLGYRSMSYYKDKFNEVCENVYIATEDGSEGKKGFVTDLIVGNIHEYDVIYTCGPKIMMKKVKELCEVYSKECYVSLEERMGCGIGACLVCACKTVEESGAWHYSKVCNDGPVFNAREVQFDD